MSSLQRLLNFEEIDINVAKIAMNAFLRLTWYLNDECVGFSFFKEGIDSDTQKDMILVMTHKQGS